MASSQFSVLSSQQAEHAGRASYEAFAVAMAPWLPAPPQWDALSVHVQKGWIAAAKAARDVTGH